ncbi:BrnA antitoxin family protein [Pelotomaculum isophthalicicum JI]|uniref:BrnA antitoxin family protein n=1 Tax=Pelotomaculum isophthalicicum JI TaxID=947010 RepID=A0A9X4H416_9FIRM|nr:CopG family antitoxin [Pelotomaculum isophthalicicum]MDF9410026.1 BrnA antitoxin family protein [Pelotomaculum isophthalicicum JI]
MPTGAKAKNKVPKFNTIDDMANFFDTMPSQNLSWEDTDLKFERQKMIQVSIRIPEKDLKIIRRRAARLGIGHTALMRMMLHRSVATGMISRKRVEEEM